MQVTRRETMALAAGAAATMGPGAIGSGLGDIGEARAASGPIDCHDALGLADLVRRREVSPLELLDASIARAEALDPKLNFMAQKHYDRARAAIARGLPDGPFRGVPWLLKGLNTYIEGTETDNGSRFHRGAIATYTSELVNRVERAGFVIFGKTTSPEFGLAPTTESSLHGATRNPWNLGHSSGGSSGGSAAAVAAGVLPAAHATDGGGSIRIPAACCGLFGMKPSRGRVPMGPARTEGWGGASCHHAITWTVRDSAAILDATHGLEPGSRYSAPTPDGSFLSQLGRSPGKLRVALMRAPLSGGPVEPQVESALDDAARLFEGLGHHVEEAAPKIDIGAVAMAGVVMMSACVAADVLERAKATGIEPGPDVLETGTLAMVGMGQGHSAMDWARANDVLMAAAVTVGRFMQSHDVILSPTLAEPPVPLGPAAPSSVKTMEEYAAWGQRVGRYSPFAQIYNLTGQPAMSLPLGMSREGLPIGIMVAGRYGEEALLFRLARQVEEAAPWSGRRPVLS